MKPCPVSLRFNSSVCSTCICLGYCRKLKSRIATDAELDNPEFLRDVRRAAFEQGKTCDEWLEHVNNLYRDYRGRIVGSDGGDAWLDMSVYEHAGIRHWFRDFCCTRCPEHVKPRLRREARERVRVLATILRAVDPVGARFWGLKGKAANDNKKDSK